MQKKEKCLIGLGRCSRFYIYILGSIIFYTLKDIVLTYSIFLKDEHIVQGLIRYIGFICLGSLFLCIFKRILRSLNKNTNINIDFSQVDETSKTSKNTKLIYHNIKTRLKSENNSGSLLIIISIIYFLYIETLKILDFFEFYYLEFWTFDILFMLLFMHTYYPTNIYRHQTFSMIFIAVINTVLLIVASILNIYEYKDNKKNIYEYKGTFVCFSVIIIYCNLSFLIYYARINIKILTDIHYISPYKIIISIGIIGFVFELMILIISFIINSESKCLQIKYNNIYCYLNSSNYFSNYSTLNGNKNKFKIIHEISVSFLYLIFYFGGLICELFIIKYLNPNYVLMSDNIYFEIIKLNKFFYEEISNKQINSNLFIQFSIIQLAQFFEFIGCLIYLELIELRFCGLNKNLKRVISERSKEDITEYISNRNTLDNGVIELNERNSSINY